MEKHWSIILAEKYAENRNLDVLGTMENDEEFFFKQKDEEFDAKTAIFKWLWEDIIPTFDFPDIEVFQKISVESNNWVLQFNAGEFFERNDKSYEFPQLSTILRILTGIEKEEIIKILSNEE